MLAEHHGPDMTAVRAPCPFAYRFPILMQVQLVPGQLQRCQATRGDIQTQPANRRWRFTGQRQTRQVQFGPEAAVVRRSEEHTSELQSLMRISYAVFCLKQKTK